MSNVSRRQARPVTKAEFAENELRGMILSGELPPGAPLPLRPIAEHLGLSVVPVRDALRTLRAEGLVSAGDHRSASVTEISPDEVIATVSLRMWIEVLAGRESAHRHDAASLKRARAALDLCEAAIDAGDDRRFSEANRRFHEAVEAPAGAVVQSLIAELWNRLWQARRHRSVFGASPSVMSRAQVEHREIFAAASERDDERLAAVLDLHRTNTLLAWAEFFRRPESITEPVSKAGFLL